MSSVFESLIFDRTQLDLDNDADRAYIAYTDLNRIEDACENLANLFGIKINKKVWKMEDFRTEAEMERLLRNIKTVRDAYFSKHSTPANPVKITYQNIYQANDIEKILYDLWDMYNSMISGQPRLSFSLGKKILGNRR
jgi:hypothetical protein|nr:MAG TPA: hypothetical protein [Caudoviricetes sp.]